MPYFDERCGSRFKLEDFEGALDRFWSDLKLFDPRSYVAQHLSMEEAARRYLAAYLSLGSN